MIDEDIDGLKSYRKIDGHYYVIRIQREYLMQTIL